VEHSAELRRCLLEADLHGLQAVWRHIAPHLAELPPDQAVISMHMARVESETMPAGIKAYSKAWLAEYGIKRTNGRWVDACVTEAPRKSVIVEAVGIASLSLGKDRTLSDLVVRAMQDALLEGLERNIVEPPMQKELMLKARQAVKFKERRL